MCCLKPASSRSSEAIARLRRPASASRPKRFSYSSRERVERRTMSWTAALEVPWFVAISDRDQSLFR